MGLTSSGGIPNSLRWSLGSVIFLANAGLLVLQLLAGRYLAPFIGSSIETWTCVIGVFLTGIALGNHFGGKIADRSPSTRTLGKWLLIGSVSSLSLILWWQICQTTSFDSAIPLGLRIPLLTALFCLPPAFALSVLTPVTIKLLMSDVSLGGRAAGIVFSLSTLGCLLGNYFTGFWFMAEYTLNTICIGVALGLAFLSLPMLLQQFTAVTHQASGAANLSFGVDPLGFRKDIRRAFAVVFVASFCGMSLELTASRVLAPVLGVSLYSWTGIIGIMLAGTACGNYLGGVLADRGLSEALKRFACLAGLLFGVAAAPALVNSLSFDPIDRSAYWPIRIMGGLFGLGIVLTAIWLNPRKVLGFYLFAIGGLIGFLFAHPVIRSLGTILNWDTSLFLQSQGQTLGFDVGSLVIHLVGAAVGGMIAYGLLYDPKQPELPKSPIFGLVLAIFGAGFLTALIVILSRMFQNHKIGLDYTLFSDNLIWSIVNWTFVLFFLPMLCLGMVSPQVIRLSLRDTATSGRVSGTIYAWSTAGAIAGTFATGYFLIDLLGMARVLYLIALILIAVSLVLGKLWQNATQLYFASIVFAMSMVGMFAGLGSNDYTRESKYYAIKVKEDEDIEPPTLTLTLDHLIHSSVRPSDPSWLHYQHEEIQGEMTRYARQQGGQNILVIGGGGYTFPRWVETMLPDVNVDVVEIDPAVTEVAYQYFGLSPQSKTIHSIHMDGRQFIRERAAKSHYQLVMQDAVNDFSVPYHLMTKEYNDAIKTTLAPKGVYLLTLIDSLEKGELWRAAVHTLRESFKYVEILDPIGFPADRRPFRNVYVIYASDEPLPLSDIKGVIKEYNARVTLVPEALSHTTPAPMAAAWEAIGDHIRQRNFTHVLDHSVLDELLQMRPKLVLTDQFAPVDNLMSRVFLEAGK